MRTDFAETQQVLVGYGNSALGDQAMLFPICNINVFCILKWFFAHHDYK